MPYTKTNWVDGETPINAANLNKLETQYDEAVAVLQNTIQIARDITLTAGAWVDDRANSGFWIYDVSDPGVDSNTVVEVYIHRTSIQTAKNAKLQPFCESATGSYRLFAELQPAGDIVVDVKKVRQVQ